MNVKTVIDNKRKTIE